jgi:hypothetical protein
MWNPEVGVVSSNHRRKEVYRDSERMKIIKSWKIRMQIHLNVCNEQARMHLQDEVDEFFLRLLGPGK